MAVVPRTEAGRPVPAFPREDWLQGPDEPDGVQEEDAALLERCRAGDVSAFESLFATHGARMKSVAMNLLGNTSDAEDAVQDSFLKVYRGAAAFRGGSRLSTWIYRVLVNSCYDMLRKRRRRAESPEQGPGGEPVSGRMLAPVSDHPLRLSLETCLARLDPRRRAAFLLFAVEGFSHREVGDILGVPEGTSRTLLFEAKRDLQRFLGDGPPPRRATA